ncbi:RNA-binding protein 41 isoform X1 [Coregonus clupeaformis]|uniref:RNA-binding protein 41 isoform X1 n=2 Tax=Coregonus clupeaformis TaxID=59861 RepID=UPI001BE0DE91|nr:RNA-binding protein 41 isoform X1 [Coregonus clupeaformis]
MVKKYFRVLPLGFMGIMTPLNLIEEEHGNMRRMTRHVCEDGPVLEEQETEGQRQLHSLLLQQLDTDVNIDRCVAKRKCFAPAALYKPFGEQAAGVRSLPQFKALQDGETELASLRELGLTDLEVELWLNRDQPENTVKGHGVCVAPGARQQRLLVIQDKIDARSELISRPQRFSASLPLSRREMEIEKALFQGNDRLGFLNALYHQEEDTQADQQGASSSDPLDSLYRDVLSDGRKHMSVSEDTELKTTGHSSLPQPQPQTDFDLSQSSWKISDQSQVQPDCKSDPLRGGIKDSDQSATMDTSGQSQDQDRPGQKRLSAPKRINMSQPIGSLCGAAKAGPGGPVMVRGEVEEVPEEEIQQNRETEEGIRSIPRFHNYQPGEPSKVLCVKNLSAHASVAQLVALFSRFDCDITQPVLYRLLTGRLKGHAFITLSDTETSQRALELVNGYRLLGKPLVIEFGRERKDEQKPKWDEEKTRECSVLSLPNPSTTDTKYYNSTSTHK